MSLAKAIFPQRTERFLTTVKWLLGDVLANRKGRCIIFLTANVAGIFSSTIAFTLLVTYVKLQSSKNLGKPFHGILRFFTTVLSDGVTTFGITILILGIFSASCLYLAQHLTLGIIRDYHKIATSHAAASIATVKIDSLSVPLLSSHHQVRHLPTLYARYTANFLRLLLESILPFAISFFAISILFYLNVMITLSLIPFGIIYGICFFHLTKRAAGTLKRYQSETAEIGSFMNGITSVLKDTSNPFLFGVVLRHMHQNVHLSETIKSLYEQTLINRQSTFMNRVFQISTMVWIIIIFGHTQGNGSATWISILAFLIALRYTWQSLMKLSTLSMEIGRFFPPVEVFEQFVRAGERFESLREKPKETKNSEMEITLFSNRREAGKVQESMQWRKGNPLLIWTSNKLNNSKILSCLSQQLECFYVEPGYYHGTLNLIPGLTIAQNALGVKEEKKTILSLKTLLSDLGVLEEVLSLPDGMDTLLTTEVTRLLSRDTRFAITSAYCILLPRTFLLLKAKNFFQLSNNFQKKFLAEVKESFIGLIFENLSEISSRTSCPGFGEATHIAIFKKNGLMEIKPKTWLNISKSF